MARKGASSLAAARRLRLLAAALLAASSFSARAGPTPDILVLLADDLGYGDLSYNGATEIKTQNIDRLAQEGIVFTSGYVTHSICTPSRAGLLTGRYPARFGMDNYLATAPHDADHGLPKSESTFAARLQEAGYATALIGKWHLGDAWPFHPLHRGFDEFYGFRGRGGRSYYMESATDGLEDNRGNGHFDGYLTDALTDRAVALLEERTAQSAPLLLILAWTAPHTPLQAPAPLIERYQQVANEDRRRYLAMVDSLDQNVGRLLDALEANGRRRNTLIFFLSDNGGHRPWRPGRESARIANNGPLRAGKTSLSEGGIRVPFIASWPQRWPQGVRYHAPVISLDIAATAVALAGASADRAQPLDGVNLDAFVLGREAAPDRALFWRRERPDRSVSWAVRAGDMKLTKATPVASPALYDLAADIGETRDLINERPEEAARLARLWNAWNQDNPRNAFPHHSEYLTRKRQLMEEMRQKGQQNARGQPFAIRLPQ